MDATDGTLRKGKKGIRQGTAGNKWGLNDKQTKFAHEYMLDCNSAHAAIRAGYSPKIADAYGSYLLLHDKVGSYIAFLREEEAKRLQISRERILDELAKIGFANIVDVADLQTAALKSNSKRLDTAAVSGIRIKQSSGQHGDSVEREFRMYDKIRALEVLGKNLGLFSDKADTAGGIQIADARNSLAERLAQQVELEPDTPGSDDAHADAGGSAST